MLIPLLLTVSAAATAEIYLGTYTPAEGRGGVYRCEIDLKTGQLSNLQLAVQTPNPSFIAFGPKAKTLYAVDETGKGMVKAWERADNGWRYLGSQPTLSSYPCHIAVDAQGQQLFIANYGTGTAVTYPLSKEGTIGEPAPFENRGSGPNASRQTGPHMHYLAPDPKGRFVYACDLGTDEVLTFRVTNGKLEKVSAVKVSPGGGPRHLAFSKDGRYAYVNSEMTCAVTSFKVDASTGSLTPLHTLSTLPSGERTNGKSTAEIACHPSGKWLYVSNRGHHSIAVYALEKNGMMRLLEVCPADVKQPRGFGIEPSGKWLIVAGQDSNDVTALAIDPKTGLLKPTGQRLSVEKPVCVAFPPR